jgi:hypothetical protein
MGLPHLGHKHPDNVEQKEEIDLQRYDIMSKSSSYVTLKEICSPRFFFYLVWGVVVTYTEHG